MAAWLCSIGNITGSFTSDIIAHDVYNTIARAFKAAGLWSFVLGIAFLLNYLFCQIKSHLFLQQLFDGVRTCFALFDSTCDVWTSYFYGPAAKD